MVNILSAFWLIFGLVPHITSYAQDCNIMIFLPSLNQIFIILSAFEQK